MYVCMYVQHGRWGFWIPDTEFQSLLVELGFWITIVSLDSGFLELYSGFKGPRFWIPQAKSSRIPDSTSKKFPDSWIQISLHGVWEGRRACSQAILRGVVVSCVVVVVCLFFRFFPFHAPFNHRAWNNDRAGAGHIVRSNVILLGHRHFWPDKFNPS